MPPQRIVEFRPRTVLQVAGLLLGVALALYVVWISLRVVTWIFVALFLALALDPAVRFLQSKGLKRRGAAAAVIYTAAIAAVALLAALFVPPLVDEAEGLADAVPGYVEDITAGRGPLGFLERDYDIVEKVRNATEGGGSLLRRGRHRARRRPRDPDRRRRVHHDRVPDAVHDPRGPGVVGARPRAAAAGVAAALAQRRPSDLADRVGLRHRQPAAVGDRGRQHDDRAARSSGSPSRSRSA